MNQKRTKVRRFLCDTSGEVPLDFLALTASVLLLGAMYIGTNSDAADDPNPGYSEEIFVRKCANVRFGANEVDFAHLRAAPTACK